MDEFSFPAIIDADPDPTPAAGPRALWFYSPEPERLRRSFSEHGPFTAATSSPRRTSGLRSPALSDVCSEDERMDVLWEDLNEELRRSSPPPPPASDAGSMLRKQREAPALPSMDVVAVRSTGRVRRRPSLAFMLRSLKQLFVARKVRRCAEQKPAK